MTYRELWQALIPAYDEREAKNIARMVFEQRFGLSLTDICMGKDKQLSEKTHSETEKLRSACCKTSQYSMFWDARPSADARSRCVPECSFRDRRQPVS